MTRVLSYLLLSLLFSVQPCRGNFPISEQNGHLWVEPSSPFSNRLKLTPVLKSPKEARNLRTVGQMLALANPSSGLMTGSVSWVELDAQLSKTSGLNLKSLKDVQVGNALGLTYVPKNYEDQLRPGQRVEIYRYGSRKTSTSGRVLSIQTVRGKQNQLQILFRLTDGQDWYPGTNCQIEFPLLRDYPFQVPKTALLHEGLQEYVIKELSPGEFVPEEVAVLGETTDSVFVMGNLIPGIRIVGEGSILLKPLLHLALTNRQADQESGYHAP